MLPVFWILLVFAPISFIGVDALCYNASREIENGRIDCRPWATTLMPGSYKCLVKCRPGYSSPERLSRCQEVPGSKEGNFSVPIEELSCSLRTTCAEYGSSDSPTNGYLSCENSGNNYTCKRGCGFPYVPAEPEYVDEHCGPDTNFFWSHVLRNNKTALPPCETALKCQDIKEVITLENGHFVCREEAWASTTFCELECDLGLMPVDDKDTMCGPSTAFRWSHEWDKSMRIDTVPGCKQSPITMQMSVLSSRGCPSSGNNVQPSLASEIIHQSKWTEVEGDKVKWELVNWQGKCALDDAGNHVINYYFNFKYKCIHGTCKDACNVLPMPNERFRQQCYNLCRRRPMQDVEILSKMRNVTLNYIAKKLLELGNLEGESTRAVVADTKSDGPFPYGHKSDYCGGRY